jgi:hypothetical protein
MQSGLASPTLRRTFAPIGEIVAWDDAASDAGHFFAFSPPQPRIDLNPPRPTEVGICTTVNGPDLTKPIKWVWKLNPECMPEDQVYHPVHHG